MEKCLQNGFFWCACIFNLIWVFQNYGSHSLSHFFYSALLLRPLQVSVKSDFLVLAEGPRLAARAFCPSSLPGISPLSPTTRNAATSTLTPVPMWGFLEGWHSRSRNDGTWVCLRTSISLARIATLACSPPSTTVWNSFPPYHIGSPCGVRSECRGWCWV